jgi:hypothetical protein
MSPRKEKVILTVQTKVAMVKCMAELRRAYPNASFRLRELELKLKNMFSVGVFLIQFYSNLFSFLFLVIVLTFFSPQNLVPTQIQKAFH